MTAAPWTGTAVLAMANQIAGFECDRASVNEWLHGKALAARPNVKTTLYLGADGSVVAFAATTMVIVSVHDGTSAQRAGSREGNSVGFLLAQMGVRTGMTGAGIGKAVLREVMAASVRAYQEGPFPLFVVDAADERLIGYYEQAGLRRLAGQLRLATPMRQIIRSFDSGE